MSKKSAHPRKAAAVSQKDNLTKRQSISIGMIVKDEEQFLERCLKSVKEIADEIIIIDTGSKDNTVNIARKYTDKIYFHPWKDSFSEARNHYLDYATGDWIFQIDADEELVQEDIPVVLKAVSDNEIDAIMVQIVSHLKNAQSQSRHNVERLFRNNGLIRYEGRVHNRLRGFKRPKICPIHLIHYGYDLDDKDLSIKKHHRRISLLNMDIKDQPSNPLPYHYISCCYLQAGQLNEALEAALKAIGLAANTNNGNPIFLWSRYNAAMAYYKLNDLKNAEALAFQAIAIDDRHIDSYYVLTLVNFARSNWVNVITYGKSYLLLIDRLGKNPAEFGTIVANSINESWNILVLMGIAGHETGRLNDSREYFKSAVASTNPFPALRAIGIYHYNKGLMEEAMKYLAKASEINNDDASVKNLLNEIRSKERSIPKISCCMIVKNEEEFLEKCLASVRDYVDELIVVDTGSTDNTVEIAKRFTDKIYFHPWENSFSKARNRALQYATGDWVFQIDGDEELMAGSGERMRTAVREAKDADVIFVKIFCTYAAGAKKSLHNFERLFRNNGKIHYEGSVHNRIVGGTRPFHSSIELWHYGYDVEEKKALEKFNRTTSLLKNEIEKEPDNPMYRHYLSASYASRGMNEDAIVESVRAVELSDCQQNNHDLYAWSHFIASMSYYRTGRFEKAKEYAVKSLDKYPVHLDSYYMLTIISADEGRWDDTIKYGQSFLKLLEHIDTTHRDKIMIENTMNEGPAVNILIGHAYHARRSSSKMKEHYNRAYDTTDIKWQTWWNIGLYHLDRSGDLELAADYLDRAAKEAPDEPEVWYMLAKLNKKRGMIKEEMDCLNRVIRLGTSDTFIYNRLLSLCLDGGRPDEAMDIILNHSDKIRDAAPRLCKTAVLCLEKGQMEPAIKCYMAALEKDGNLFEAWVSLGEIMLAMNNIEDAKIFFEKALSLKDSDLGTIVNLCDVASRQGDLTAVVRYCDLLLKALKPPRKKTLDNINDLKEILNLIVSDFPENSYYRNRRAAVSERISSIQDRPVNSKTSASGN